MYFCSIVSSRLSGTSCTPIGVEREAQQVGQLQRHVLGGRPVIARQRGNGVQGVEEEVRLQLDLQHFQLRVRQLRFQLRRLQFALAILAVIADGLRDQQDVPVALEVHERARQHVCDEWNVASGVQVTNGSSQTMIARADEGQGDAGDQDAAAAPSSSCCARR